MKTRGKITIFLAVTLFLFVPAGFAVEGNTVLQLQGEIAALKDRLAALEQRLANSEKGAPSSNYIVPAGEKPKGLLRMAEDIEIGGYVDAQYNQNFTNSGATVASGNTGRIFDKDRDSFTLNAFEINLTREADPEGGAGFRVDLAYGEDSTVVNADGDGDTVNLQQAYIEYVAPLAFWEDNSILPSSVNLKAGRFATLAGLEVIEGPDNWNISRSFAFGMTIPFVHTGIRAQFGLFDDFLDMYLGLNNGWDNPVDNNTYKTLEAGMGYSPLKNVSLFHALYWGPEDTATNGHKRFLLTNVATWDVTDKLSLMSEFNFGNQRREQTAGFENIQWYSYNFYARYQLTDKWALAYRGELFKDNKSFRSGLDRDLWEQTLTAEYAFTDKMLGRLEWRYDKADNVGIYADESSQIILGAQLLYSF